MSRLRPPAVFGSVLLCALGCGSARLDPPPVEESSTELPSSLVRAARAKPFSPSCTIIDAGATVEWRNLTPLVRISVRSPRPPFELSSPALTTPYNLVEPAQSDECARTVDGVCVERLSFSYWRHTFRTPGVFDYSDQSGGGQAGTSYSYGMPVGPSVTSAATGTVCVRGQAASGATVDCAKVCCTGTRSDECEAGVSCIAGRCGGVSL